MRPEQQLIWFSWVYLVVMFLAILIPYLRRKSELVTTWNLFLLSLANFIGISGLAAGYDPEHFRIFEFTRRDYFDFMVGATVFTIALFLFHRYVKFPTRQAERRLRKWPPATPTVLFFMVGFASLLGLAALFPIQYQGLGQLIVHVGNKGSIFAFAFAFIAWWKQRKNPLLAATVLGTFLYALLLAILAGTGRRNLFGVLAVVPIALYWMTMRTQSRKLTLTILGITGFLGMTVIAAYSELRHFDVGQEKEERNASKAISIIKTIPTVMFKSSTHHFLGQNSVQIALTTIHLYRHDLDTSPFHATKMILLTPIPRAFWPDKPDSLGYTLPMDARVNTQANWGPNIVGHGYHEGGLHMLVFYAFLAACSILFVDRLLALQPDNPYLIGFLAAACGHIAGWARGDIATFTNQIIFCFLAMLLLAGVGRLFFGSRKPYLNTLSHPLASAKLKRSYRQAH